MFFAYGFGNSITFPFSAGAATLLLPGQPKPAAIFEAIQRFRPSVFFGLPTLYTSLTKADGAAATDFSSLRMALSAAELLSAEVFNGSKNLTGLWLASQSVAALDPSTVCNGKCADSWESHPISTVSASPGHGNRNRRLWHDGRNCGFIVFCAMRDCRIFFRTDCLLGRKT